MVLKPVLSQALNDTSLNIFTSQLKMSCSAASEPYRWLDVTDPSVDPAEQVEAGPSLVRALDRQEVESAGGIVNVQ
jgi:hypothetical protein